MSRRRGHEPYKPSDLKREVATRTSVSRYACILLEYGSLALTLWYGPVSR